MRQRTAAVAAACLGVLIAAGWFAARTAFAAECLTSPQESTPIGHHWYYRVDRATGGKCWYLKKVDAAAEKKAATPVPLSTGSTGDQPRSSGSKPSHLDHEALFEEFLRWQKQQDHQR